MQRLWFWLVLMCVVQVLVAQDTIWLKNPSFEHYKKHGGVCYPEDWHGACAGTTADVLPGQWQVTQPAAHGKTYLGLITREDGSFEAVSQRLPVPLLPDCCYHFKLSLAHCETYARHNLPIRLRVWGGNSNARDQLLWESDLITHKDWKEYDVRFLTRRPVRYLIFEAYYAPGVFVKYRGNVLIDHVGPIIRCPRA